MNIFKRFFLIFLTISLVGCATAPIESRNQASRHLNGQCLETFLNSAGGGFDGHYGVYLSQPLNKLMNPLGLGPKGYFAVAIAANGSNACGWKTNMAGSDLGLSYERLAEEALAKCDVSRRQKAISEPCKLFAKDMDVIYEKNAPVKRMY